MPTLPIDEAALREAMRDRRYWQPGHPERERYGAWVTGAAPDQGADTVGHVRAYERRGPDGDVIQVQAHTRGASPRPWENQPNPEWRAQIAEREVRGIAENFGYGARNPGSSAMGRYQMLSAALQESGWKDSAGGWTDRARRAGVTSDDDFLANPQAREAAFGDYMASNEVRLQNRGLFRLSGRTIRGASGKDVPVTDAGLAAAAHRAGVTAVARYFERRARNAPAEGADLAIETRLREFSTVPYRRAGQR